MKILFLGNGHLIPDNYPHVNRGGSVQTWGICKELAKRGYDVYIVRRGWNEGEEIIEKVRLMSIKFEGIENKVPNFSPFFHMSVLFSKLYFSTRSRHVIQKINPDVICFIDRQTAFFPANLDSQKVFIIHSSEAFDFFKPYSLHGDKLNSALFPLIKQLQNRIVKRSDCIVVLNHFIEEYFRKRGVSKVIRIPNGIDFNFFSNKGNENFLLYVGRFDWNKNVISLVNAFAEVAGAHPSYKLYLVGEGPKKKEIQFLVKNTGLQSRVRIMPWLPRRNIIELMARCSFFILPSLFEVFPVVILEAMASEKAVIARRNMGSSEVILPWYNGLLYDEEKELIKYIAMLIEDDKLKIKLGTNARKTVEEKYTFEKVANLYEKSLFSSLEKANH